MLLLCHFSTVETPSCSLASRERIYKSNDVAGPATAISSLSHKLKGGYACRCRQAIQNTLEVYKKVFSYFNLSHSHSLKKNSLCLVFNLLDCSELFNDMLNVGVCW